MYRLICLNVFTLFTSCLIGQIWFKLELLEDGETYQVSLISEEDWSLPNNITSTGQISLKAPTLEFEITDFESVNPALEWNFNSRFNAPDESADFDYFSFGLESSNRDFDYEAGEEMPIIRFKNAKGCSDFVTLVENDLDPYIASKDRRVNVGNQLTVFGARGNAYKGNKGEKLVKCQKLIKAKENYIDDYKIYPNPASNVVNLDLNWKENGQQSQFYIRDNAGRVVLERQESLTKGFNQLNFDITNLQGGIYHIEIIDAKQASISLDRFVKIYSASIDNMNVKEEEEPNSSKKEND